MDRFVHLVRSYCDLVENVDLVNAHQLLSRAAICLGEIYSLALALPEVALDEAWNDIPASKAYKSPAGTIAKKLGQFDGYAEVYDPVFGEDVVLTLLSDDLADIYLDLRRPLDVFDSGKDGAQPQAIWDWKFKLRGHCGDHIVDALRPIQRLINDHMASDYEASKD